MSNGSHGFLGEEFLTWLWFQEETQGGEFTLSRDRIVGISFDDLLVFAPRDDEDVEQQLRKGIPSRSHVARTALRQGHGLAMARVTLAMDQRTWAVTLVGKTLELRSIRWPEDDEDSMSSEARTEDRVSALWDLREIVAALYERFLRVRLAPGYQEGQGQAQAEWMARGVG